MKTKQETDCVIKVYAPHASLKKWSIIGEKAPFRQKIQVSSNLEQVVMFYLISKNFVELKIIYIRDYL